MPKEPVNEFDEPSCPQTGTGGMHHESYYEGSRCQWCGAIPRPEEEEKEQGNA